MRFRELGVGTWGCGPKARTPGFDLSLAFVRREPRRGGRGRVSSTSWERNLASLFRCSCSSQGAGRVNPFLDLLVSGLCSLSWCQLRESEAKACEPWEWHVTPVDLATFQVSQLDLLFQVAPAVSNFPPSSWPCNTIPACGIPLPTRLGKMPRVRFEVEVAWRRQCQASQMCFVEGGLRGFLRDCVAYAATADSGAKCLVACRVCIYSGRARVFHDVPKLHWAFSGNDGGTSWLRNMIQRLDLKMPWSDCALYIIHKRPQYLRSAIFYAALFILFHG